MKPRSTEERGQGFKYPGRGPQAQEPRELDLRTRRQRTWTSGPGAKDLDLRLRRQGTWTSGPGAKGPEPQAQAPRDLNLRRRS
ncbi:hypothetical protein ACSSS7_006750 [Eimeria intestinalis]